MQEANAREEKIRVSPFLGNFRDYREKIRAIGSLIEKDCLPPGSEEGSELASLKDAYQSASGDYNELEQKRQNLSAQELICQSLAKLSTAVNDFGAIHKFYSNLANAKAKGKGRAQTESFVESPADTSMKGGSPSSDQLIIRDRELRDRELAEALQKQEYEDALHSDLENDQSSSEGKHDQSSSQHDNVRGRLVQADRSPIRVGSRAFRQLLLEVAVGVPAPLSDFPVASAFLLLVDVFSFLVFSRASRRYRST